MSDYCENSVDGYHKFTKREPIHCYECGALKPRTPEEGEKSLDGSGSALPGPSAPEAIKNPDDTCGVCSGKPWPALTEKHGGKCPSCLVPTYAGFILRAAPSALIRPWIASLRECMADATKAGAPMLRWRLGTIADGIESALEAPAESPQGEPSNPRGGV